MPIFSFLDRLTRSPVTQPAPANPLKTAARVKQRIKDNQKNTVLALRNFSSPDKKTQREWLTQLKAHLYPGETGSISGSGAATSTGGSAPTPTPNVNDIQQTLSYKGRMPIKANKPALDLLEKLKTQNNYSRIKFPSPLIGGGKILAYNTTTRQFELIGIVVVNYEKETSPSSKNNIGMALSVRNNNASEMLICTVTYPALPTSLAIAKQSS